MIDSDKSVTTSNIKVPRLNSFLTFCHLRKLIDGSSLTFPRLAYLFQFSPFLVTLNFLTLKMSGNFGWIDYVVVGATLLFSILIGVYYAVIAKQATNEDLLVGGRNMGIMPIAASMLVTYLSAITVLGKLLIYYESIIEFE